MQNTKEKKTKKSAIGPFLHDTQRKPQQHSQQSSAHGYKTLVTFNNQYLFVLLHRKYATL